LVLKYDHHSIYFLMLIFFLCIQDIDGNGQEKIMKAINVIYNDIKLGI